MKNEHFTKAQALPKMKQFCAYQERCHQEVKDKLYGFGLNKNEVEELICILIDENYLNEQRFAIQFAGGRFRMKGWGKVKIKYELKQRQVSKVCITKSLQQFEEAEYEKVLRQHAALKWKSLKGEENIFIKRRKLLNNLLQKGFEADLCRLVMDELEK